MHVLEEALWVSVALVAIFGLIFVLAVVEARMFAVVMIDEDVVEAEPEEYEPLRQAA